MSKTIPYVEVSTLEADRRGPNVPTLNPNNEPVVDMIAATDSNVELGAWINPGIKPGDELVIRMIRRSEWIDGGVDQSNKARITLKVIAPGTRRKDQNYSGFDRKTFFTFPAFTLEPTLFGPAFVIFRWDGVSWLPVFSKLPTAA